MPVTSQAPTARRHTGATPTRAAGTGFVRANPVVEWLLDEAWTVGDSTTLIQGYAAQLVAHGLPLSCLRVFIHSLQPEARGVRYTWQREHGCSRELSAPPGAARAGRRENGRLLATSAGTKALVGCPDGPHPRLDWSTAEDFVPAGEADPVVMALQFSEGPTNLIAFTSDRPGGFTDGELGEIKDSLRVLTRLLEIHAVRRAAKELLTTYLGRHTGERVQRGLVKRGDGEDIHAVIWFCDLRDSTPMADSMSRAAFLEVLNGFFDCMAGAVLDHGGEVLRFIGDATLAIFAVGTSSSGVQRGCCDIATACHAALAAAKDAQARMRALNQQRAQAGASPLRFGLALHMGDVTYGNIGVPQRLEFTVIGAPANEAARLEGLCKTLDRSVLVSSAFKGCFPGELVSLGSHRMRGVGAPVEVFTLPP